MRPSAAFVAVAAAALIAACGNLGAGPEPEPDVTPPVDEEEFFDDGEDGVEDEGGAHDVDPDLTEDGEE